MSDWWTLAEELRVRGNDGQVNEQWLPCSEVSTGEFNAKSQASRS